MKKDKEFDDIFKKGLGTPAERNYQEQDWNALEKMLDGNKKRRGIVFWLPILSSAAILLIALGWWVLRPETVANQHQKPQLAAQPAVQQSGASKVPIQPAVEQGKVNTPANLATQNGVAVATVKRDKNTSATGFSVTKPSINNAYQVNNNKPGIGINGGNNITVTPAGNGNETLINTAPPQPVILAAINPALTSSALGSKLTIDSVDVKHEALAVTTPDKTNKITTKSIFVLHPRYALSVFGAPEVNGVNSFQETRSGTNVGLVFSAGLFKKITLSTGALYAIKPYNTYFSNYYGNNQNSNNLSSINADCRVLDIPLNVDFQVYSKNRNSFSIGSGLSSYIMLHESYQYNYTNPTVNGAVNYTVPNTNKYIFGVLNLQATYTRQINSAMGLSFQPYLKLPLTGIGANNAKLQTAGVAIGLSWNLNSLSNP